MSVVNRTLETWWIFVGSVHSNLWKLWKVRKFWMDGSMVSSAPWNPWEQFCWNHKKEKQRVKMDPDTQCKQRLEWSSMYNRGHSCCFWDSRWICWFLLWSVDYASLLPWQHSSEIMKNLTAAGKCESYRVQHQIRPAESKKKNLQSS